MSMSDINYFSLQQKKVFHSHQSVYQYNKMFYVLSKWNFLLPEVTEGIRSKKLLHASNFLKEESITCWPWWAATLELTLSSHNLPNSAGTSWQRNSEWLPCDQLEADGFDYFNKPVLNPLHMQCCTVSDKWLLLLPPLPCNTLTCASW